MAQRLDGIDVSKHQESIDWGKVSTSLPDLRFVMCRMTHGGRDNTNLRVDEQGLSNQERMRQHYAQTPRGYYHFLGNSDPGVQAAHFRNTVGDLQPGEFLMVDVEVDPPADVGHHEPAFIADVLEAIEGEFRLTPWLYIPQPGNYPKSDDARLHRFPLMLPIYDPEPKFQLFAATMRRPTMVWQWGGDDNGVKVPGIRNGQARVDSNIILDEQRFLSTLMPGLGSSRNPIRGFIGNASITVPGAALGFLKPLHFGDRGNTVILLQTLLIEHGVFQDRDRNRDGRYEDGTVAGVKRFQLARGLPDTGEVDDATWVELASIH
jgi:GH25 family lysozyme M1 (1,4-beta-N-acetylmuramidase)